MELDPSAANFSAISSWNGSGVAEAAPKKSKAKRKFKKKSKGAKAKAKRSLGKKSKTNKKRLKSKKRRKGLSGSRAKRNARPTPDRLIPLELITSMVLFLFYGIVLIIHRNRERKESAPSKISDQSSGAPAPNFEATPVFLDGNTGPDPHANQIAGVQLNLNQSKEKEDADSAEALDQIIKGNSGVNHPENEPEFDSEGKDMLTSIPQAAPIEKRSPAPTKNILLTLPVEMAGLFEPLHKEKNVWQCKWNLPLVSKGTLLVSSKRLLVVYEKTQLSLIPPFHKVELRRHQSNLSSITKSELVSVRRPSFLIAGLGLCWWHPIGTIASVFCLSAYIFLPRRELGIFTKMAQMRTYPLEKGHLREAIKTIDHVKNSAEPADPLKKVS